MWNNADLVKWGIKRESIFPAFHAGDTGSNPVGDTNNIKGLADFASPFSLLDGMQSVLIAPWFENQLQIPFNFWYSTLSIIMMKSFSKTALRNDYKGVK